MAHALARAIAREPYANSIDVVIPVPETSYISALATAQSMGRPFAFGLVKNTYVGRTFIMPSQGKRRKGVERKLNTVRSEFEGKHVLLVDDSIVRGTTSRTIVQMAYAAGAQKHTRGRSNRRGKFWDVTASFTLGVTAWNDSVDGVLYIVQ
ncbi:hypothetical protein MBLNU13_g07118t1 [Cladosporium sp. NU13]